MQLLARLFQLLLELPVNCLIVWEFESNVRVNRLKMIEINFFLINWEKRILVIFSVLHYRLFLIKLRRLGTASILFIKKICLSWRGEKKGIILSKIEGSRVLTSPNIFFISCMSELKVLLSVWQSLDSDNTGNRCRRHRSRKRWWRE